MTSVNQLQAQASESGAKQRSARCLFQRPEWESVFAAYRLRVYWLTASTPGRTTGTLPLVHLKSRTFGNQLVSLPWFDAAGVEAEHDEAADELVRQALELAARLRVDVVQLRQREPLDLSPHVRTDKVVSRLDLPADPEVLWKGFKPTVRNQVRKAEKCGLSVQRGGGELLDGFYRVYSRNMRDLGSPSHSKKLFDAVLNTFPNEASIYVVNLENEVIGGGFTLGNGSTLEIPWASSLREHNSKCVNHALYWQILEDACRDGYAEFSFGRSTPDSGPHRFKKQWGPRDETLYWYFLSHDPQRAAAAAVPPQEKFGFASRVWQRLPLIVSRALGPRLMARIA